MKFTRQFDQMDCGPACICMVASAYGKDYPLSYLRSLSHLTREGVSVSGIRHALEELGMDSAAFEMTPEQLRGKCPLPAILHWEQNHFVVLYKIKQNRWTGKWNYYIANPAYGKHGFTEESFSRFWLNDDKGVVIAIEPRDDFLRKSLSKKSTAFYALPINMYGPTDGNFHSQRLVCCSVCCSHSLHHSSRRLW